MSTFNQFLKSVKPRFYTIGWRVAWGYLALFACLLVIMTVWFRVHRETRRVDNQLVNIHLPLSLELKELAQQVESTRELVRSLGSGGGPTAAAMLRRMHSHDLRQSYNDVQALLNQETDMKGQEQVRRCLRELEAMITVQERLLGDLAALAPDNEAGRQLVRQAFVAEAEPQADAVQKTVNATVLQQAQAVQQLQGQWQQQYSLLTLTLLGMLMVFAAVAVVSWRLTSRSISQPLHRLADAINAMRRGQLMQLETEERRDEIGRMHHVVRQMLESLRQKADFAHQIGQGNFEQPFEPEGREDAFGQALLEMRTNLQRSANEEFKRTWIATGLTQASDLLRSHAQNSQELYDRVLAFVIKYTGANQGAFFIADHSLKDHVHLEMAACYAYNKRKAVSQHIEPGQGLVGQVFVDKETLFMTDVPASYVAITSGLGEATPRCLLITPLKLNNEVQGVIELASFEVLPDYKITFMEAVAEGIAATISMVQMNERTKRLLLESQQQTEEMRAQEEEMRQNMEELAATQEEIHRRSVELDGTLRAINGTLATADFSMSGVIIDVNQNLAALLGYEPDQLFGKDFNYIIDGERSHIDPSQLWNQLRQGNAQQFELRMTGHEGRDAWVHTTFTPVKNTSGMLAKVIMLASNITHNKLRSLASDALLEAVRGVMAVAELDAQGNIISANDIFARMTRYDLSQLVGMPHRQLFDATYATGPVYAQLWHRLLQGQLITEDHTYFRGDGQPLQVRVRYAPIANLSGQTARIVLFAINLSKLKNEGPEQVTHQLPEAL